MKRLLGNLFILMLIFGSVACVKEVPKEKIVVQKEYVKVNPFTADESCDRGVDFIGSECDRKINDKTFWLSQKDIEVKYKEERLGGWLPDKKKTAKVKTNVVYEFSPSEDPSKVGDFRRGVYLEDPKSGKVMGYKEKGYVSRVSHNAIDFVVTADSCNGERVNASNSVESQEDNNTVDSNQTENNKDENNSMVTKYYTRGKNGLHLQNNMPRNALEEILLFPVNMTFTIIFSVFDLLTTNTAEDIFDENMSLEHYYFDMDKLPVNWGCSADGDFKVTTQYISI